MNRNAIICSESELSKLWDREYYKLIIKIKMETNVVINYLLSTINCLICEIC